MNIIWRRNCLKSCGKCSYCLECNYQHCWSITYIVFLQIVQDTLMTTGLRPLNMCQFSVFISVVFAMSTCIFSITLRTGCCNWLGLLSNISFHSYEKMFCAAYNWRRQEFTKEGLNLEIYYYQIQLTTPWRAGRGFGFVLLRASSGGWTHGC